MLLLMLCLALTPGPGPTVAEQIQKTIADFQEREKAFYQELRAARGDRAKIIKANEDFDAKWDQLSDDLRTLVKRHPDDPAAVDGLIGLTGPMRSLLGPELTKLAIQRRDDPRMGALCFNLATRGQERWATSIVDAVAESNHDRTAHALAVFAQAQQANEVAFSQGQGVPRDIDDDPLVIRVRKLYRQAATYADVMTPNGKRSVASLARSELHRLDNLPNLRVGGVAPEIAGTDLNGKPLRLSDHRGKVVAIVFWGSWCSPCMAMAPHEKELHERMRGKPFALIGVNGGDSREKAQRTASEKGMTWPSWHSGEAPREGIAIEYDIQSWPTVFVLDAKGVIRHRFVGNDPEKLDNAVDALMAEMAGPKAP